MIASVVAHGLTVLVMTRSNLTETALAWAIGGGHHKIAARLK